MQHGPKTKYRTYGILNLTLSVLLAYLIMTAFSSRGIYNWSAKLAVTPFTQDLKKNSELFWAEASQFGLEEPRLSLEAWFLGLQDAHPLLYPKSYERAVELRKKRELRKAEKARIA